MILGNVCGIGNLAIGYNCNYIFPGVRNDHGVKVERCRRLIYPELDKARFFVLHFLHLMIESVQVLARIRAVKTIGKVTNSYGRSRFLLPAER